MEKKKSKKWFFLLFALIFLICSVFVTMKYIEEDKYFKEVEATVTDVFVREVGSWNDNKKEYYTYIEYTVDGIEYTGCLQYYRVGLKANDKINIVYDTRNPEIVNNSGASMFFCVCMYSAFVICLVASIVTFLKDKKDLEW